MARTSVLATLLFTDIVGSTNVAEEMGDRRWRELLNRHHRTLRAALREHGGREVDTAGDGVFSWFDSPAAAIRCAAAAIDGVRELGIEIRAGVHIGECEVLDGKPSGVNVHVGARTMAQAEAGEIVVTGSVRDLVRGAGFGFEDRGVHELRGVAGEWPLFAVTSVDGEARPPVAAEAEARARRDAVAPPPIVQRRRVRIAALAAVAVVVLAAASLAFARAFAGSSSMLTGCEVTQNAPVKDSAFNEGVYNGLTDAGTKLGMVVRTFVSPRFDERVWEQKMNAAVADGCNVVVAVGDPMFLTTIAAARRNPRRHFIVSDTEQRSTLPNVTTISFHPDEAAFEAGYLAAGMTKTGKVGTFGGIPAPNVTSFMDGFAGGVRTYNQVHHTHVRLLPRLFVSSNPAVFGAFIDKPGARRLARRLVTDGADVLFPVDGPTGEQAAGAVASTKPGVVLIGVDGDQFFLSPGYSHLWLTSVQKQYATMVDLATRNALAGKSGVLDGRLANRGVGLAPFHVFADRVPKPLVDELRTLTALAT